MGNGKQTFMNAPIDLHGHINEQGERVKCLLNVLMLPNSKLLGNQCASDMMALCLMPLSVLDRSSMVSALSQGCSLNSRTTRSDACGFT